MKWTDRKWGIYKKWEDTSYKYFHKIESFPTITEQMKTKLTSQQVYEICFGNFYQDLKPIANNNPRCPYPRRKVK